MGLLHSEKIWIIFAGMTIGEIFAKILDAAVPVYGGREAHAVARYIMRERFGVSRADLVMEPDRDAANPEDLGRILSEVAAGRPVQYITGSVEFCGLRLQVSPGVLIPRPETEELVEWIISDAPATPSILDIGTGSGSIALALANAIPGAKLTATDISGEALEIARKNAQDTGLDINFLQNDILDPATSGRIGGRFDIIVSNPPYIPQRQAASMHINVRNYEPSGALFVPDDDPLLFYRAITGFSTSGLKTGGALYFEVHEESADDVTRHLAAEGFRKVELRCDINGKKRMVRARKS
ncbi:MAG: peptide chain release factor N(5)-glutamine methyltransferase [Rikenellaceae bacterium]|nr:peptide chain release factor N(5)-glutamine methyltransferase [Rikenellaceae bacterium]